MWVLRIFGVSDTCKQRRICWNNINPLRCTAEIISQRAFRCFFSLSRARRIQFRTIQNKIALPQTMFQSIYRKDIQHFISFPSEGDFLEHSLDLLVFPMPDSVSSPSRSPSHRSHGFPPPVLEVTLNLPLHLLLLHLLPANRPAQDLLQLTNLKLRLLQLRLKLLNRFSAADLTSVFDFLAPWRYLPFCSFPLLLSIPRNSY